MFVLCSSSASSIQIANYHADYLPVYFQATKLASPIRSAVMMLPVSFLVAPFAIVAGAVIQTSNKYRPTNAVGWIISMVGIGIMTLLDADSSTGEWVGYQIIASIGTGVMVRSSNHLYTKASLTCQ
jgi:hypothetical protein